MIDLKDLPMAEISNYLELNPPALPYNSLVGYPSAGYLPFAAAISAASGGASLGNGSIEARFARIGNTVHYYGRLTIGSTTNLGVDDLFITLPTQAKRWDFFALHQGSAVALVGSSVWQLTCDVSQDWLSFLGSVVFGGGARFVTGSSVAYGGPWPGAWANGDTLHWSVVYEAL